VKVVDVTQCVAGRGAIAIVEGVPLDLHKDDTLVSKSDGKVWSIAGMEYAGYRKGDDTIGFVLGSQQPPKVGEKLTYYAEALTKQRLHKLCLEQQARIERLELALVLATPPHAMVTRLHEVTTMLESGKHVWVQPFRDSDGAFFLRVEAGKKGKDDGNS